MLEGSATLFDVLAIVIAFSTVMLLLSLLVTSIAQAIQAGLRLRARNLQSGLRALVEQEFGFSRGGARRFAATLLNSPEISVLKNRRDPTSLLARFLGPVVSWVEPEQLRVAIANTSGKPGVGERGKRAGSEAPEDGKPARLNGEAAAKRFMLMDAPLKKRFAYFMRIVTVVVGLAVAIVMQVDAFALLKRLSTDREYRGDLVARAEQVLEYGEAQFEREKAQDVCAAALEDLLSAHPDLRGSVVVLSGVSGFLEACEEDVADQLEGDADRDDLLAEFEDYLTKQLEAQRTRALADAEETMDQLATISITPWRQGTAFYWNGGLQANAILGVLATAILLSLGAPFWFNLLQKMVGLRDLLSPPPPEKKKEKEGSAS